MLLAPPTVRKGTPFVYLLLTNMVPLLRVKDFPAVLLTVYKRGRAILF